MFCLFLTDWALRPNRWCISFQIMVQGRYALLYLLGRDVNIITSVLYENDSLFAGLTIYEIKRYTR